MLTTKSMSCHLSCGKNVLLCENMLSKSTATGYCKNTDRKPIHWYYRAKEAWIVQ